MEAQPAPRPLRDDIYVAAARRGDLDAFEVLILRYEGAVSRIALGMLGSTADADDAAQETFIKAWRSLPGFRGDSAFETWLYRIATNCCLTALASRRPVEQISDRHGARSIDPADVVEQTQRFEAVSAAILTLPGGQRAAVVLRELQGLSYREVADTLGISLAAVKGRIHRARLTIVREMGVWE